MASISTDKTGNRTIYVTNIDRKRRPIRLGKCSIKQARTVLLFVEDLVKAANTNSSISDKTAAWLNEIGDELRERLAKAGLTERHKSVTLGAFTRKYIDDRTDIKPRTRINLEQARTYLVQKFNESQSLRSFTQGDADDFRQHLIGQGKADNTVRRAIGRARQFFAAAKRRKLIEENPFVGIAASVRANAERFYFVSAADAIKVLDACPDAQWRAIFALARFGGLRCPSEVLSLLWTDVNWEQSRIRVTSPKTAHLEGGGSRVVPLFPELRPHLLEAFEQAAPGAINVITRYRGGNANLRTQLHRIIKRAGLEPWPKTFQNLRSTRETELAESFPMHAVCKWIGNSQPVAAAHYLQVTDEHFKRASEEPAKVVRNPARAMATDAATDRQGEYPQSALDAKERHISLSTAISSTYEVPPRGVEPLFSD